MEDWVAEEVCPLTPVQLTVSRTPSIERKWMSVKARSQSGVSNWEITNSPFLPSFA